MDENENDEEEEEIEGEDDEDVFTWLLQGGIINNNNTSGSNSPMPLPLLFSGNNTPAGGGGGATITDGGGGMSKFTWADVLLLEPEEAGDFNPVAELLNMAETPRVLSTNSQQQQQQQQQLQMQDSERHQARRTHSMDSLFSILLDNPASSSSSSLSSSSNSTLMAASSTMLTSTTAAAERPTKRRMAIESFQGSAAPFTKINPKEDSSKIKKTTTSKKKAIPPVTTSGGGGGEKLNAYQQKIKAQRELEDMHLPPKERAIREKNREAVRNCRKRKRDYEIAIHQRSIKLQEENAWLKSQIRMLSGDAQLETINEEKDLLHMLHLCVNSSPELLKSDRTALADATINYGARVAETAKEREIAIGFLLSRLLVDMLPVESTKMLLWISSQETSFFERRGGMWDGLVRSLKLTPDQIRDFRIKEAPKISTLRMEVENTFLAFRRLREIIMDEKKIKFESEFLETLNSVLNPVQFAQFLCLLNDKSEQHNMDWDSFIGSFETDAQAYFESVSTTSSTSTTSNLAGNTGTARVGDTRVTPLTNGGASPSPGRDVSERVKILHQERVASTNMVAELFMVQSNSIDELTVIARRSLSEDVALFDPNNGGESHGIGGFVQYIRRIKLAFSGLVVKCLDLILDGGKARGTWLLEGVYAGRLKPTTASETPTRVSFTVVLTFQFKQNSNRIEDIVVSWDSLSLMVQLGLLNKSILFRRKNAINAAEAARRQLSGITEKQIDADKAKIAARTLTNEEINEIRKRSYDDLRQMFLTDDEAIVSLLAKKALTNNCIFLDSSMISEFEGVNECIGYIRRVRRPFPKLLVDSQNILHEAAIDSRGNDLPFTRRNPVEARWTCSAIYGGTLAKKVTLIITFSQTTHDIEMVRFSWDARTLLTALGVMNEPAAASEAKTTTTTASIMSPPPARPHQLQPPFN